MSVWAVKGGGVKGEGVAEPSTQAAAHLRISGFIAGELIIGQPHKRCHQAVFKHDWKGPRYQMPGHCRLECSCNTQGVLPGKLL